MPSPVPENLLIVGVSKGVTRPKNTFLGVDQCVRKINKIFCIQDSTRDILSRV